MGGSGSGRRPNPLNIGKPKPFVSNGEELFIPNLSGDHSKGHVGTPVNDTDIANKKYVDDHAGGTTHNILSATHTDSTAASVSRGSIIVGDSTPKWKELTIGTNAQVLTSDGTDISWQDPTGGSGSGTVNTIKEDGVQVGGADIVTLDFLGSDFNLTESPDTEINISINDAGIDHDSTTNYVANEHIDWTGDAGANNINNANITDLPIANTALVAGTNLTLSTNTLSVDDAFIKNDADDTSTGKITAANFAVTGDNNTDDSSYVPMVLHGTDDTPPTASNFPKGTIYIKYTA